MLGALLDTEKPLCTHYGAIMCLHHLGPMVVENVLLEAVSAYSKHLSAQLDSENPRTRSDALKVEEALLV